MVGAIRRVGGVLPVLLLAACTVAPKVVDFQGFQERTFQARPKPAEIQKRDTGELLAGGYLLIGFIDLRRNLQTCYVDNTCVQHSESLPPQEELQQEAARRGGDVVTVLEERTVLDPAPRQDCTGTSAQTMYINNTPVVTFVCNSYTTVDGTQEARVSRALVWRYAPDEAATEAGTAANAQAIDKAMAALDAAASRRDTRGQSAIANAVDAVLGMPGRRADAAKAAGDATARRVFSAIAMRDTAAFDAFAKDGTLRTWTDPEGRSVLMTALSAGELESARALARLDAGKGRVDGKGYTTAEYAVSGGDAALLDQLLRDGLELGPSMTGGRPLLFMSAFNADAGVYDWLLAHGHDNRTRDEAGNGFLIIAASAGQLELVSRLLAQGLDPNAPGADGETPLMSAAAGGHDTVVGKLLGAGAKAEARDTSGRTLMHYAAYGGSPAVLDLVRAKGLSLNAEDSEQRIPLVDAVANKQWAAMGWLLDQGAVYATERFPPVAFAWTLVAGNQTALLDRYRTRFPELDSEFKGDPEWLHHAAEQAGAEAVNYLLDHGADINATLGTGLTPLLTAATAGNAATCTALLARKADGDARDRQGRSALQIATQAGHADAVAALRAGGLAR